MMSNDTALKAAESRKLQLRQEWPAAALIGTGLALLLANLFDWHLMALVWPGFVLVPGLLLMWPAANSTAVYQRRLSFLAVPGGAIATVGLLLFLMNLSGYFEAWAYAWPLVFVGGAAGWMYMKRFDESHRVHSRGYRFIRTMVLLTMGLVVFFEVLVFENYHPLLALGLIGYGIFMLASNRRQAKAA